MTYRTYPTNPRNRRDAAKVRYGMAGLCTVGAALAALIGGAAYVDASHAPAAPRYELVSIYQGDALILDTGLTGDDCAAALTMAKAYRVVPGGDAMYPGEVLTCEAQ